MNGMLYGVSEERLLNLTSQERRLLKNTKTAYDDFVKEFLDGEHRKSLRTLLNGLDAAATLHGSLIGKPITRAGNKRKNVEFLMTETPTTNPPVSLLERDKQAPRSFTLFDMIYEVRCQMDHAYEDLDSRQPHVDNHVLLSWSLWEYFSARWVIPALVHPGDRITLNAYALIHKIANMLEKLIFGIEGPAQIAEIEKKKANLNLDEITDVPYTIGTVKSAHPSFHEILKRAGFIKEQLLTQKEFQKMMKTLEFGGQEFDRQFI